MPDQPSWIEAVPAILEALEQLAAPPFLDRTAVEALFGLRRRQAIHLLGRMGGYQVGKALVAPREAVIRFLRDPRRTAAAAHERGRFERVRGALGKSREDLGQRRISIPAPPPQQSAGTGLAGLPDGVRLEARRLTVEFANPVELIQKLFALSHALTTDYEAFERSFYDL
jgi:hypothetical protein